MQHPQRKLSEINSDESILLVQRSGKNQGVFFLLIAGTGLFAAYELFFGGRLGTFTAFMAAVTIWQGLRTYKRSTTFLPDHIEHETLLGKRQSAAYRDLFITFDRGESITLAGVDTKGASLAIQLSKSDGNLEKIAEFLRSRIEQAA